MARLAFDETGITTLSDDQLRRELDLIGYRLFSGKASECDLEFLRELDFELLRRRPILP